MKNFNVNTILTLSVFICCISLFLDGLAELVLLGVVCAGMLLSAIPVIRKKKCSLSLKLMFAMFGFIVAGKFLNRMGAFDASNIMLVIAAIFFFLLAFRLLCFLITHDYRKEADEIENPKDRKV